MSDPARVPPCHACALAHTAQRVARKPVSALSRLPLRIGVVACSLLCPFAVRLGLYAAGDGWRLAS